MRLVLQARWLNQPNEMLIAVYKTKKGKVVYLTGNEISKLLRKAIKKVHLTLLRTNSSSTPLIPCRFGLRIFIDKVGKLPDYIKKRLRWLGDSFRMYLRDTAIIQHQHVDALLAALQEIMDLIAALPKDVIALSTMKEGTDDPNMHEYADQMD
jgi:hypothetical protein